MTTTQASSADQAGAGVPSDALRVSDAERERTVEVLRGHYETGHLGYAEFDHRLGQAYQATYSHELGALLADLPGGHGQRVNAPAVAGGQSPRPRSGAGRVLAICALVLASLVGLSWLTGTVTHHPLLALVAIAALVWVVVKKPFRRRD